MLNDIPTNGRSDYVLPEMAAQYQRDATAISKRIQDHFTACGVRTIKPGTGKGTGKRAVVEVGFHSLRHTFVSLCRESNAPLSVVEAIVGHSNPAMTRHYTHVSESAAATAVNALPVFLGETSPALPARIPLPVWAREMIEHMTPENLEAMKAELLKF